MNTIVWFYFMILVSKNHEIKRNNSILISFDFEKKSLSNSKNDNKNKFCSLTSRCSETVTLIVGAEYVPVLTMDVLSCRPKYTENMEPNVG
jgi:hypothetical protein